MANAWITQEALEIGLEGDELDSTLTYAGNQGSKKKGGLPSPLRVKLLERHNMPCAALAR
jgi:hypothetical protein